jgi:formiminotetrahydrofolate cyclodeaminase
MRSDLEVARLMATAGARGAMANVEINLDGINDHAYVQSIREKLAALRLRLESAQQSTRAAVPAPIASL